MTITRYRKRPIEVDTVQWTGSNEAELIAFTNHRFEAVPPEDRAEDPEITAQVFDVLHSTWVGVYTGQHVVCGVKGEFYPVAEDVLAETYEPAVVSAGPAPATDRADLRDHIADVAVPILLDTLPKVIARARSYEIADAVLSVLPASIDQAAVRAEAFREAAVAVRRGAFADTFDRMADETPQPETEPPLLFWDESAGAVHHDGRVAVWINKAVNLAEFAPAGQLILQVQAAGQLRDALGAALAEAAPAVVAQPDGEA